MAVTRRGQAAWRSMVAGQRAAAGQAWRLVKVDVPTGRVFDIELYSSEVTWVEVLYGNSVESAD
jgi:hypothetical protein